MSPELKARPTIYPESTRANYPQHSADVQFPTHTPVPGFFHPLCQGWTYSYSLLYATHTLWPAPTPILWGSPWGRYSHNSRLRVEESKWQSWAPTGPGLGPLHSDAQLARQRRPPELTLALLLVLLHLNPSLSAALLPGLLLALPLPLLNVICGVVRWSGGRPRTTWQLTPPRWLAAKGTREGPADWMNGWRVSARFRDSWPKSLLPSTLGF